MMIIGDGGGENKEEKVDATLGCCGLGPAWFVEGRRCFSGTAVESLDFLLFAALLHASAAHIITSVIHAQKKAQFLPSAPYARTKSL